jgi:hypothetical protein
MTKPGPIELAGPTELALTTAPDASAPHAPAQVFRFGDPESVLDRRELAAYFEIWHNGRWYEPPLPMGRLSQTFNMSPYHRSAIALKVNLLVAQQSPSRWLAADVFERWALDFLQMGNAYLEFVPIWPGVWRRSPTARPSTPAPVEPGVFWWTNCARGEEHAYAPGAVFQLQQPDVAQEIYGLPEWLSALQSGLLSENATLFRRRYYLNGAHAGFVFYGASRWPIRPPSMPLRSSSAAPGASAISGTCWSTSPRGRRTASRSCRSPT